MGETSRKWDMEELMKCCNNVMELLKEEKDVACLKHLLRQSESLRCQCVKDFDEVRKSGQDCEEKIKACKQKAADAESANAADAELDKLLRELEEEQQRERMLKKEFRAITNEIDHTEQQSVPGEERMQSFKKLEQDDKRDQMKLSVYASVTNIVPHIDDVSKTSGYIVERENKAVQKFEFDPSNGSAFDTCNNIWKMLNL